MTRRTFVLLPLALAANRPAIASPRHAGGSERAALRPPYAGALDGIASPVAGGPEKGVLAGSGSAHRRQVRVRVLGLFHPRIVTIAPGEGGEIALLGDGVTRILRVRDEARVVLGARSLEVDWGKSAGFFAHGATPFTASALRVVGAAGGAASLRIGVPGKIARTFHGCAELTVAGAEIATIVSIDLETAVASVVAAEQIASTPIEALAAQAVAGRSYYIAARGRHRGFDFCDTTHCQFLREPPPAGAPASRATRDTARLVLSYGGEPIAALYSAHCGGRTKSLADAGLPGQDGYPYFSVECRPCANAPAFRGYGAGHGVGLCQAGAAALARDGMSWREILAHYYPASRITS